MGETGQLAATGPAAAVLDPPAGPPNLDVPQPAPSAVREDLPSERLHRLADRAAARDGVRAVPGAFRELETPSGSHRTRAQDKGHYPAERDAGRLPDRSPTPVSFPITSEARPAYLRH